MDKYKDLTLAGLEVLFAEKKAEFDTLTGLASPTFGQVQEANGLAEELEGISAALVKAKEFVGLSGRTFATEPAKAKDEESTGNEVPAGSAAPESTGVAEQNPKVVEEVPVADQTRTDERGEHNTDAPAEQARVGHTESVQDPVDPAQIKPGEVVGEDGKGVPLQSRSAVETLAARTGRPELPAHRTRGSARIRAASGLDEFGAGTRMENTLDIARGAVERVRSFPDWQEPTGQVLEMAQAGIPQLQKFGTATIDLDIPRELMVDDIAMSPEQIDDVLALAADETSLPGGSLVAAGGWCAPSETVYDLSHDATDEGMLKHPEVGIRRGGLKWPISPQFSDFYANPGFKYTEAQVIGGVTKPCVTIPCPSWDEARLSVEGLCIKVDILTNVGYPEAVRNFVDGTMIAHQHWMNATKIGAMVTSAGAALVVGASAQGSTFNDTLNYLDAIADRTRQKYRLRFNTTMEVVLPYWVRGAIKMDLSNRTGLAPTQVTDAQIDGFFRARKLNPQWVYDWQDLPTADVGGTAGFNEAIVYPTTFQVLMYPAGTFIFGTAPVINLSTVYDATSLAANQYTGLFTEQGWLVAKRKFEATLVTMPVCNAGRTGSANITNCGVAA